MKVLSRDFTRKEKLLIGLLLIVLSVLSYYRFLDQPVRDAIAAAQAEQASLQVELDAVNAKIRTLERMRRELEDINASGEVSLMPSYNNNKSVLALLNDILDGTIQYSVSFPAVTRDGDQIRRSFSLQFSVYTYEEARFILEQLAKSPYRCLLGDLRCAEVKYRRTGYLLEVEEVETITINVNATATFFETMVGGVEDAGLPADKAAAK